MDLWFAEEQIERVDRLLEQWEEEIGNIDRKTMRSEMLVASLQQCDGYPSVNHQRLKNHQPDENSRSKKLIGKNLRVYNFPVQRNNLSRIGAYVISVDKAN